MNRNVTVKNYQEYAGRTMANLDYLAVDGAHMALGFTTELGELAEAMESNNLPHIREEHGDAHWYIANACTLYGLSYEGTIKTALEHTNLGVFKLHNIADLFKRELAYKKEMNLVALQTELVLMVQFLMEVSSYYGFSLEESLQKNIDKLFVRFPDKFNEADALMRDLKKESETLQ